MRKIDDYIPVELFHEAKNFFDDMEGDVEIYKKAREIGAIKNCEEADKFVAYWTFERFNKFPHALITLYEFKPEIDMAYGKIEVDSAFDFLQYRMKSYYLLLKENGMINE